MDFDSMTEEEQIQAAMAMSLGQTPIPGGQAQTAPPPAPAETFVSSRGRVRSFPAKDSQDQLPPCPRSTSKKSKSSAEAVGSRPVHLSEREASDLFRLVFEPGLDAADIERWLDVGFQFSPADETAMGLWQRRGGPCGIFAPVQAYLLKNLLFDGEGAERTIPGAPKKANALADIGNKDMRSSLTAHALATILYQSTPLSTYFIVQVSTPDTGASSSPFPKPVHATGSQQATAAAQAAALALSSGSCPLTVSGHCVSRISEASSILEEGLDSWLGGPCGVLSFLCSVLLTRTIETVQQDMDEVSNSMIGRFGHCNQEVVNLMLIGEAVTNVFDGTQCECLKGVEPDRVGTPKIGYLSELEVSRHVEVGTLYKHPEVPIWVLGSQTHYTVLFSLKEGDAKLSEQAEIEKKAERVFFAFGEGLTPATNLPQLLSGMGLPASKQAEAQQALVQEEIIIYQDFKAWILRQFGISDSDAQASVQLDLYLYDGQDPPGPSLKSVYIEQSDIDPQLAGVDLDTFSGTLNTRWPRSSVTVSPVAGAGSESSTKQKL